MAIEKTIVLNVNAQEALKELTKLGKQFEEDYQNADNLTAEIGALEDALYEMARSGKQGTKEFKDLSAEVGRMKKVIIDTDMAVDGMSQTLAQNLGGALGGITSAFELGAGAMGAMGVESEMVEEALLRVQSASAIAQGFQGIRESVSSFKALGVAIRSSAVAQKVLNVVMAANPIGLIITAIAALIAGIVALISNFEAITNWLGITDDAAETLHQENLRRTEEFIEQQGKRIDAISKERDEIEGLRKFEVEMMKARGDSEEDIFKAVRKNRIERINANNEFQKQVKQQNDALISQFKLLKESGDLTDEQAKEINAKIEKNNETIRAAQTESKTLLEQIKLDDVRTTREAEEEKEKIRKEAFEKRKARVIAEMEEEARLRRDHDNFIKDLEERLALEKELKEKAAQEDKEREQALLEQIQASLDAELAAEEAKVDAAIEADNKKKELAEAELQRERELQNAKLELAGATLQGIGSLVNAFAGENEEQQRRAFNISKAISIAQATIDTYKGATAAFASTAASPLGIANPAAPFIAAAAAVAAGLANVATIARQQYQGGSSGGAGGGAGASNPPAELSNPATFNVVGNTGTNQLAQTLGQQPLQAYVVAGDVTSAQSLERNKIQQSTL
jgi:hypothetical protein